MAAKLTRLIHKLPNTPSWRGAQLKHKDNFTLTLIFMNISWAYVGKVKYRGGWPLPPEIKNIR